MKKYVLISALAIFGVGILAKVLPKSDSPEVVVENLNDLSPNKAAFTAIFQKTDIFQEIKKMQNFSFEEDKKLNKKYVQGIGYKDGDFVVFRMETLVNPSGNNYILKMLKAGETCTGINCRKCSFATGGGCDCNRMGDVHTGSEAYCNHTITKGDK